MKKKMLCIAIISSFELLGNVSATTQSQADDTTDENNVTVNVENKPTFNQKFDQTIIMPSEKNDPTDCTSLRGEDLKHCLACQSSQDFRKNMKAMKDYAILAYWHSLTPEEHRLYKESLDKYDETKCNDETHWNEFLANRQDRKKFPPTLRQARKSLGIAYDQGRHGPIIASWLISSSGDAKELDAKAEAFDSEPPLYPLLWEFSHCNFERIFGKDPLQDERFRHIFEKIKRESFRK